MKARPSILCLMRKGEASLPSFLSLSRQHPDIAVDIAFSSYSRIEEQNIDDGKTIHHFAGGKWAGIYDFFKQHAGQLDRYDYFWFPDDDIETTPENALRFFDIVREQGFALAQPALTPDSYYAYPITLANPRFHFRRTNFVELMMPILRRDLLRAVLPLFRDRHAAMGMDFFWQQLTPRPERDVAIVDAVAMGHYRPRKTHLKGKMSAMNVDIHAERDQTMEEFSVNPQPLAILSAVTTSGRELHRGPKLWLTHLRGLHHVRRQMSRQPLPGWAVWKHMKNQWVFRDDLPCFDRQAYERFISAYHAGK